MAFHYNPKIVTDGLTFCLDGANTKSYPGSGTTVTDLSGNGNNGSITGSVDFADNGFTVNAQTEGIVVSFDAVTTWTLSLWFRKNSNGGAYARIAGSGSTIDRGELAILGDESLYYNGPFSNLGWADTNVDVATNEIANVVAIFDTSQTSSDNVLFYKNGVNKYSTTLTTVEGGTTNSYTLMARSDFNTEFLPSTLYSAQMYNRVLSESEVKQNFNATRGRFGL